MAPVADPSRTPGQDAGPFVADRTWSELGPHVWLKILVLAGLLGVLFRTEIGEMVHLWLTDPSWSHGVLIPLFSLYFVHQRRREILSLEPVRDPLWERLSGRRPQRLLSNQTRANYLGLLLLLLILAFHVFNVVSPAGYAYLRPISMIATAAAVVLFLGGWRLVRCTWLPIAFFVFAIPLPRRYYLGLTMPMRQLSAAIATTLLNLIPDLEVTASGVVIEVVYQGRRLDPALDVAEACSGMRLLMAFLALGVAMAYLHERPLWQRLVLLASTAPIAIFCNIVRVTVTGFLYVLVGQEYTQGIYHDMLGLAMLPLAFGLYGLLAWFMATLFIEEDEGGGQGVVLRRRANG